MSADINKTIVVSYDEVSRMKEFCLQNNSVSREFYDWYLNEDAFFTRTGMLIIEKAFQDEKLKFCISFNFTNANVVLFSLYDYPTQACVAEFRFVRNENITMEKVKLLLKNYDKKYFQDNKLAFFDTNDASVRNNIREAVKRPEKKNYTVNKNTPKGQLINERNKLAKDIQATNKRLEDIRKQIAHEVCVQAVYYCYATMYYFAKNKPKQIIGKRRDGLIADGLQKQITVAYKYTGYVNINEHKIYKSAIKRPQGEEARKYGRHIEKWSVRGHYRRVNDKNIWIEAHERGEGELEKRIYGTEPESQVPIIPKVFEVERNVSGVKEEPSIMRVTPLAAPVDRVQKLTYIFDKPIENKKQSLITRFKNKIKKWIGLK